MYKQTCLNYWWLGSICAGSIVLFLVLYFFCPIKGTINNSTISSIISILGFVFSIFAFDFSKKSFKQERFEITFFNLLDQRKKTIDSVFVKCEDLDGFSFVLNTYKGEEAWKRICEELTYIQGTLFNPIYLQPINDISPCSELSDCLRGSIETVEVDIRYCYFRRVNFTYQITKKIFDEAKKDKTTDEKLKRCFGILVAHDMIFNEHYFRLLQLILMMLKDVGDDKYSKILLAQMSKYELKVLYCMQLVDNGFRLLLKEANIEQILKLEFKSLL